MAATHLEFMHYHCRLMSACFALYVCSRYSARPTVRLLQRVWRGHTSAQKQHSRVRFINIVTRSSLLQSASASSSSPPLVAPGLLLRCLPPFLLPRAPAWPFDSSFRTKAKSTPIVCSSNFSPFAPSIAAFASSTVGYSIRA